MGPIIEGEFDQCPAGQPIRHSLHEEGWWRSNHKYRLQAGFAADSIRSAYGASKAGVIHLTKYIAAQYGKDRIRCNAVAPGLILTPAAEKNMPPKLLDIFMKYNALPYHGEADDIGNTVLFLASDESKFITGQTIQIEGGHYISNPTIPDFKGGTLL